MTNLTLWAHINIISSWCVIIESFLFPQHFVHRNISPQNRYSWNSKRKSQDVINNKSSTNTSIYREPPIPGFALHFNFIRVQVLRFTSADHRVNVHFLGHIYTHTLFPADIRIPVPLNTQEKRLFLYIFNAAVADTYAKKSLYGHFGGANVAF